MDPSITVVIPVWDSPYVECLAQAVASVRRQDEDARIVVVDNDSTVPLPPLEGVAVIGSDTRLSTGAARNLGLRQVQTEYVVFMDADDELLEGALRDLESRLRRDPALAVAVTSILDESTGERHRNPRAFVPALARRRRLFALAECVWSLYPTQGCAMFRTAQARDAGGYADADWGEDWVLAVSLTARGAVDISPLLGYFYRTTEYSMASAPKRSSELAASAGRVRDRLRADSATPAWLRFLLPLILVLQLTVVYLVRPAYLALRRVTSPRRPPGQQGSR
jgi:glycosyltransferase involved in cell wall biosynthesis